MNQDWNLEKDRILVYFKKSIVSFAICYAYYCNQQSYYPIRNNSNVTHFFQASFINRVWSNELCCWYQLFHAKIWYQSFWIVVCALKRNIWKIHHNDVKNDLPIIELIKLTKKEFETELSTYQDSSTSYVVIIKGIKSDQSLNTLRKPLEFDEIYKSLKTSSYFCLILSESTY